MLLIKKEKTRLDVIVIQAVVEGSISVNDAAKLLTNSLRQIYPLVAKAHKRGMADVLTLIVGALHTTRVMTCFGERSSSWPRPPIATLMIVTYKNYSPAITPFMSIARVYAKRCGRLDWRPNAHGARRSIGHAASVVRPSG